MIKRKQLYNSPKAEMTKVEIGLVVSLIALIIAVAFMIAVNVNRVQSVQAEEQQYNGKVIGTDGDILIIRFEDVDISELIKEGSMATMSPLECPIQNTEFEPTPIPSFPDCNKEIVIFALTD